MLSSRLLPRFVSLLAIALFFTATKVALSDELPANVEIGADDLFVPTGFDDNDEIIAVIDGYLPTACHRLLGANVTFRPGKKIVITPRARHHQGDCPDVVVPFTQEVSLGHLAAGDYLVMTRDGRQVRTLNVKRAEYPGPDEYLYAPVDRAWVIHRPGDRRVAVLEGRITNSCLVLKEVKVERTGKTIQVLPIMAWSETDGPCRKVERAYRTEVELPPLPEEGRYLLHVRTMNGQSVNECFFRTTPQP